MAVLPAICNCCAILPLASQWRDAQGDDEIEVWPHMLASGVGTEARQKDVIHSPRDLFPRNAGGDCARFRTECFPQGYMMEFSEVERVSLTTEGAQVESWERGQGRV